MSLPSACSPPYAPIDDWTINETCSNEIPCRIDFNLECQNSKCQCLPLFPFWSSQQSKCKVFSNYNEACSVQNECDSSKSLVCNSEPDSCNCPLNITKNYCDCSKRTKDNEFYWDGTLCVSAGDFDEDCSEDYMCKGVTQGTYCDSEEEHCNCVKSFFFDLDEEICKSKLPYGENCTQIDACVDEVSIYCIDGVCQCDSTYLWLNGKCSKVLTYNEGSCSSDTQCEGNLICKINTESCECPLKITNNYCDCPTRVKGNEFYWNGLSCAPAIEFERNCLNSNSSYMCQTLTQGTECVLDSNGNFACKCPSTKYLYSSN